MLDTISMAEQLRGEYREAFEKADVYSTMETGADAVSEEKLMELYDSLMEAQKDGVSVEKIVGNDIEKFCKKFFEEEVEPVKPPVKFAMEVYFIARIMAVFTIIDILLREEGTDWKTMNSNLLPFIGGIGVGFILSLFLKYAIKPMIFKSKKLKPIAYYVIIVVSYVGSIILAVVLVGDMNINVRSIWLLIPCVIYIAIYLMIRSIWRYQKHGTIKNIHKESKEDKEIKKEFNKELSEKSTEGIVVEALSKRYSKICKKKSKKNQEYTYEEFDQKIRKEEAGMKIADKFIALFFVAVVLVPTADSIINESIVDGLILGVILGVVEFAVYRFFSKASKEGSDARIQILDQCKEQGITIVEYVEKMEQEEDMAK